MIASTRNGVVNGKGGGGGNSKGDPKQATKPKPVVSEPIPMTLKEKVTESVDTSHSMKSGSTSQKPSGQSGPSKQKPPTRSTKPKVQSGGGSTEGRSQMKEPEQQTETAAKTSQQVKGQGRTGGRLPSEGSNPPQARRYTANSGSGSGSTGKQDQGKKVNSDSSSVHSDQRHKETRRNPPPPPAADAGSAAGAASSASSSSAAGKSKSYSQREKSPEGGNSSVGSGALKTNGQLQSRERGPSGTRVEVGTSKGRVDAGVQSKKIKARSVSPSDEPSSGINPSYNSVSTAAVANLRKKTPRRIAVRPRSSSLSAPPVEEKADSQAQHSSAHKIVSSSREFDVPAGGRQVRVGNSQIAVAAQIKPGNGTSSPSQRRSTVSGSPALMGKPQSKLKPNRAAPLRPIRTSTSSDGAHQSSVASRAVTMRSASDSCEPRERSPSPAHESRSSPRFGVKGRQSSPHRGQSESPKPSGKGSTNSPRIGARGRSPSLPFPTQSKSASVSATKSIDSALIAGKKEAWITDSSGESVTGTSGPSVCVDVPRRATYTPKPAAPGRSKPPVQPRQGKRDGHALLPNKHQMQSSN